MDVRRPNLYHLYSLMFLILLLVPATVFAVDVDTTLTKDPEKPKKSAGSVLLSIPSTLLKLPFYAPEGIARGLVYVGYDRPYGRQLIGFLFDEGRLINPTFGTGGNGGFGSGAIIQLRNTITRPDVWLVSGTYSFSKYQSYSAKYIAPALVGQRIGISLEASYDFMPREPYFGPGNGSRDDNEVTYTHERNTVFGSILINARQPLSVHLKGGFNAHNITDGDDPTLESNLDSLQSRFDLSPSDVRSTRYWSAEAGIRHDWRDHKGQSASGGLEELSVTYYTGVDRSPELNFFKIKLDTRQYLELFKKRILEFRGLAQSIDVVDPDNRPDNPIYLLSELGGPDGLRGYEPVRFVDKELALVSIEYRYPLWRILDGYWFFEEGRVFNSFTNDVFFENWHYTFGTGLRVWGQSGEVFRVEVARSKESTRFIFNLGFGG